METKFLSIVLLFSLFICFTFAQQGLWTQLTPSTSPPTHFGSAYAYDSSSNSMLIFGGNNGNDLNDLWSYNISSNSWIQLTPSNSPPVRYLPAGVYVPSSNSFLIFGGETNAGTQLGDLWSYNISSNSWIQLNASNPPSPRCCQPAVYVSSSNSMLIFGGATNAGTQLGDLWSYNISSNSWIQLTPSNPPSARDGHSAIYVSASNSMLIFGGYDGNILNDLWSYDISSNTWIQLNASNPPPVRDENAAVYISSSNSMLIFGGSNGVNSYLADLWSYNISSNSWTQLNASNPPPARGYQSVVYVPSSNSMLIFGGLSNTGPLNDLWDYTPLAITTTQQVTGQQTTQQAISQGSLLQISSFIIFLILLCV